MRSSSLTGPPSVVPPVGPQSCLLVFVPACCVVPSPIITVGAVTCRPSSKAPSAPALLSSSNHHHQPHTAALIVADHSAPAPSPWSRDRQREKCVFRVASFVDHRRTAVARVGRWRLERTKKRGSTTDQSTSVILASWQSPGAGKAIYRPSLPHCCCAATQPLDPVRRVGGDHGIASGGGRSLHGVRSARGRSGRQGERCPQE